MKKTVKNYSDKITKRKLLELEEISLRYYAVKKDVFSHFGSLEGLEYLRYPRAVRDEWVKEERKFNLQARYWKMALDEAFSNIKTTWQSKFTNIRSKANKKFDNKEKHFINYILCSYELVYKVIKNIKFDIEKFKDLKHKEKLKRWLRKQLRKSFHKTKQKKHCSFMLDNNMYTYFVRKNKLWISVMSLTPMKRINIKLTSSIKHDGNLRIVIKNNRIEIHETEDVQEIKLTTQENIIGIDKGLNPMIHTNTNNKYGNKFSDISYEESDRLNNKNAVRKKLLNIKKKHEQKNNFKKANKINKHNLGYKKYNKQKNKNKAKIENYINKELNVFFETEKPSELIMENLNFSGGKKFSKKMNRRLSSWMKGYLKERLNFKCLQNSVLDTYVNPAYTSQLCFCGSLNTKRTGNTIHCLSCGRVVDANLLGACNIKARKNDADIHLFTPHSEVKKILLDRYINKTDVNCYIPDLSSSLLLGSFILPTSEKINQEQINH